MSSLAEFLKKDSKIAFYGRYSTDKQDLTMQLHSVERLAEKYECKIVEKYVDRKTSATKVPLTKRKFLVKLLDDMEKHLFDAIIVYNSDRLARDPIEHQYIRNTAAKNKIPVILSAIESLYDMGDLVAQLVKDGLTKFESDTTRDRTRDTFKYKTENGELIGGILPFGYKLDKGKVKQKSDEIEIVKLIFKRYKSGIGFNAIANQLNEKYDSFGAWTKDKVKRIVTNPFYTGLTSMNRINKKSHNSINDREDWVIGESKAMDPVIEREEWEYCFKLYENRKLGLFPPRHFKTHFILKDLLYCKKCELPLEGKNQITKSNSGKEYGSIIYRCPNHLKGDCNDEIRFDADEIHKVIFRLVKKAILTNDQMGERGLLFSELQKSFKKDIESINSDIEKLRKQLGEDTQEINKVDHEIQTLLKNGKGKDDLLPILQLYRDEMMKNMKRTEVLINEKYERRQFINVALDDYQLWEDLYHEFEKDSSEETDEHLDRNITLRRAYLHLIDRIEIERREAKGKYYYRGMGKSIRSSFMDDEFLVNITLKITIQPELGIDPNQMTKRKESVQLSKEDVAFAKKLEQAIEKQIEEAKKKGTPLKDVKFDLKIVED